MQPGHYGAAGTGVAIAKVRIGTAWNVHGKTDRGSFANEVRKAFGIELPIKPNTVARSEKVDVLWLGPASWLIVSAGHLDGYAAKRDAVTGVRGALFDVTCARSAWRVSGARARDVLAKACPLDLHPRAFPSGSCAQSLFGHVNALFSRSDDGFTLLAARSFANDVWRLLCESAAQYGCDVLPDVPFR
jgi:sarcosine oxidase subunit gamma